MPLSVPADGMQNSKAGNVIIRSLSGFCRAYIGIMENTMETTIPHVRGMGYMGIIKSYHPRSNLGAADAGHNRRSRIHVRPNAVLTHCS